MRAFGEGFGEGIGPEKLGMSKASEDWLRKIGIFAPKEGSNNPFQAFNEAIIMPAAQSLDAWTRLPGAVFRGAQAAVAETGAQLGQPQLGREIAAIPEAFMGSPGGLARPRPAGIPADLPIVTEAPKQSAAAKAAGYIDAYHGSPFDFEKFDVSKIGTGEGAQAYGHGLYFAEREGVARSYRDSLGDGNATIDGKPFDPYNPLHAAVASIEESGSREKAIEDVREAIKRDPGDPSEHFSKVLRILESERELPKLEGTTGQLYSVRINADPDHFLDWDRPLSEQSEFVKDALVKGDLISEWGGNLEQAGDARGSSINESLTHRFGNEQKAADALRAVGISGFKYLDAGSRGAGDGTRNYVVFNHDDIEITHKNGTPVTLMDDAKDLSVIGQDKLPMAEQPPAEAAQRTMAAERTPDEKVQSAPIEAPDPWQERFNHFVGRLDKPDDIKQFIKDAAEQNDNFIDARQGTAKFSTIEDAAEAAGVDPGEIGPKQYFKRDAEMRVAIQGMLQATENFKQAAEDVRTDASPENLIKLQKAIMQRDLWVEQSVGLRAEWGRTGNVMQEFMRDVKDQETLTNFLKDKGRSPADLRGLADAVEGLDRSQTARFLSDMRDPTAWDKFRYYWVNSLISGPVTHMKYIVANAAFGAYESAVVTPLAGVIGHGMRFFDKDREGVFIGEAPARLWGLVAGVPDAVKAAVQAGKTGMQTPLPGELAQNIIPKNNRNLPFQQKPIPGALGTVIGLPSRGASAIHSFFNFLGYRASIEAQAYRQAAKEGLKPTDDAFWQRRGAVADQPTTEMMNSAIEEGYRLTYINELGPVGRKLSQFVNATKVGQLVMPFVHIPMNILQRALEGTPAAYLSAETRDALAGRSGAVKQDMAIARIVAGSAVGAWAVNAVLNDRMTGYGPTDQKERLQWLATGHQPYSIRIGDEWISFNRFGSIGTMLGLYSNLAETIPHIAHAEQEGELAKAIGLTVHATGRLMEDEVGMQGLANLMSAIDDPQRSGARYVSGFAGSLLPYSSALRQTASAMDPSMREAKTIVDGLRYYIPGLRQGLNPKRDWLGQPIPNAGYGGDLPAPGVSAIMQHRDAVPDPIGLEMQALDMRPAPPQDRIKGVKLTPSMYDTYQATAGPYLKQVLDQYVNSPGWHDLPVSARQEVIRSTIRATRESAAAAMQMQYPQLIEQAVKNRVDRINGVKPTKLKD